jgi:hypothetical protein
VDDSSSAPAAAGALRRGLIALAVLGVAGTAVELAMERHWKSTVQLIPWFTLAVIAVGVVLLVVRPAAGRVRLVRVLMVVVFASATFGVFEHVSANYDAGPLDARYSKRWATMSTFDRWRAAATHAVGPSPPLAPAVVAQAALCLGLATLHHPALSGRERRPDG